MFQRLFSFLDILGWINPCGCCESFKNMSSRASIVADLSDIPALLATKAGFAGRTSTYAKETTMLLTAITKIALYFMMFANGSVLMAIFTGAIADFMSPS